MIKVVFPDHLMPNTEGVRETEVDCDSYRSLVRELDKRWPGIEDVLGAQYLDEPVLMRKVRVQGFRLIGPT